MDPSKTHIRTHRRGTSLVEIVMAAGIMASVLIPIGYYFVNTGKQQAALKSEAMAAGYAAKAMNHLLDEVPFEDLASGMSGGETIDGTEVQWSVEVSEIVDLEFEVNGSPMPIRILDAKNRGKAQIKDIRMTIQWKGPRDADFNTTSRQQVLVTRRARL